MPLRRPKGVFDTFVARRPEKHSAGRLIFYCRRNAVLMQCYPAAEMRPTRGALACSLTGLEGCPPERQGDQNPQFRSAGVPGRVASDVFGQHPQQA